MANEGPKNRVLAYIDGFNLYHGLKDKSWRQFYWLDPAELVRQLVTGGRQVEGVKYFTARVRGPEDKRRRQSVFLDAVEVHSDAETILGRFYQKPRACKKCGNSWTSHEEKMTDSAIAAHLVADAFLDAFDTALMIGGDTDIVPAMKLVKRHFPEKRIEAWFPPRRKNQQVADVAHDSGNIHGAHLGKSLMPDQIEVTPGVVLCRPAEWA